MFSFRSLTNKLVLFLFFSLLLVAGLELYPDYGISFDEFFELQTGLVSLKYLVELFAPQLLTQHEWLKNVPPLETYVDADHGVTVLLPFAILKAVLGIHTWQETFLLRHLLTFLIFYVGVFFFYLLARERFRDPKVALLGCLILVLSPRIFAEAFYNSKDIPFLSFMIMGAYTLIRFMKAPSFKTAFFHAITCALAIDTRIMGVILPFITAVLVLIAIFRSKSSLRTYVLYFGVYLLLLAPIMVALWPYLWEDPIDRFILVFRNMQRFRWYETVFYMGHAVLATNLPWHYIPVWLIITTPLVYSILFFIGLGFILNRVFSSDGAITQNIFQFDLACILFLFIPIAAVILLNSVVYDGWRHLYFIYFAFLLISLVGLENLWQLTTKLTLYQQYGRIFLVTLVGISLIHSLWFMVRNHPHQNVYFSFLKGKAVEQNFERDYWGLSYRQGLEFILQQDSSAVIKYNCANPPGLLNTFILPERHRQRFKLVPLSEATYFLTEYRWHPGTYPYPNEIYTIQVNDFKILSIFKLR
ncbi:ArnT family glycosyltransferase [Adhaeribacter rhizoryzae]|uniref:Phospholipid carrier-dependent glycosyltransferase n=1 Tax=Adhaeribacter rhizoryzae TaxID=2607907 RepID=A0A5M6D9D8_9BACT|nr:glycosyltransferase family 39 protein [Adhaeribacter rhizoryzae]KAA5544158.1 phospholipid carrier-dependent glycosyltransferase [Adhaeribacter rhizoryzae]